MNTQSCDLPHNGGITPPNGKHNEIRIRSGSHEETGKYPSVIGNFPIKRHQGHAVHDRPSEPGDACFAMDFIGVHAHRRNRTLALLPCVLFLAGQASAATFLCVSNSDSFQSALTTAAGNGEDDVIQLMAGGYSVPLGAGFTYSTTESFGLTIVGGYVSIPGVPGCFSAEPAQATVISGGHVKRALELVAAAGSTGEIVLRNVSLVQGNAGASNNGGGLRVGGAGFLGRIEIDRVQFLDNLAAVGGALHATTDGNRVRVHDSLFAGNRAHQDFAAAFLTAASVDVSHFGSNTVVAGSCSASAPSSCDGGVFVGSSALNPFGNTDWYITNDLFFGNTGSDLHAVSGALYRIYNVNAGVITGTIPSAFDHLTDFEDPGFVNSAFGNYRLRAGSPLRDTGTNSFYFSLEDLDGKPRLNGAAIDVGSYEVQESIFADQFEEHG